MGLFRHPKYRWLWTLAVLVSVGFFVYGLNQIHFGGRENFILDFHPNWQIPALWQSAQHVSQRQLSVSGVHNVHIERQHQPTDFVYYRNDSLQEVKDAKNQSDVIPTAYVITPTYAHLTQQAELTRLCYTLIHAQHIHWIVVEDSQNMTSPVKDILRHCQASSSTLTVTHLLTLTPNASRHRGLAQRNAGLDWIRRNAPPGIQAGGVYFADDDNTYDVRVFEAVRRTVTVSVWPVGLVAGALYEGPLCSSGKVTGWRACWEGARHFPVDMAAFSIGLNFLLQHPASRFQEKTVAGYLEDAFLRSFNLTLSQLTPGLDPNCSKVLVWHTKTKKPVAKEPKTFPPRLKH